MHDLTDPRTLHSIRTKWKEQVNTFAGSNGKEPVLCVVGNKSDLKQDHAAASPQVRTTCISMGVEIHLLP